MVLQKIKSFSTKFLVSVALTAAPLVALGGISHADGTVNWTGQGADSVKACQSGQTPYLHWIFTTGGNSSVTSVNLTVGGAASGGGAMSQHGGSWTENTGYSGTGQPTTGTVSAHVTYTGSLGNGTANLVISDGCYGSGSNNGGGGGQGGGGGTTNNSGGSGGGQVLGASGQSQVSQVPSGSVNGGGGGISDFSLTSLARTW